MNDIDNLVLGLVVSIGSALAGTAIQVVIAVWILRWMEVIP